MKAKKEIITRLLPKTGQATSYRNRDDGYYEGGWWRGRLNANNKSRFVLKQVIADRIVIDKATGLMWGAEGDGDACNAGLSVDWEDAIGYTWTLTFAGFSDWRIPNVAELFSIVNFAGYNPCVYSSFFTDTVLEAYWTSTTYVYNTLNAFVISFVNGNTLNAPKSSSYYLRCVRGGL